LTYLGEKHLFIRLHHGGFENGLHRANLGYFHCEHPRGADMSVWQTNIHTAINDYWSDTDLWTDENRKKFIADNPKFATDAEVTFPLIVSSNRLISTEDNKKIATDVIQATTPIAYADAVKFLLDGALEKKLTKIADFMPAGLRREDPKMYHHLLNAHAKFMHLHRKIQLLDVTSENLDFEVDGHSLRDHLTAKSPAVQSLRHDPETNRVHITTDKAHFPALCQWIDTELLTMPFPFNVTRLSAVKIPRTTRTQSAKYASLFSDQMSVTTADSFDASTISPKSPPLAIQYSYDPSPTTFPPLPTSNKQTTDTQSTAPSTLADETAVSTAIETAIKATEK
jgi:hypothetical protein